MLKAAAALTAGLVAAGLSMVGIDERPDIEPIGARAQTVIDMSHSRTAERNGAMHSDVYTGTFGPAHNIAPPLDLLAIRRTGAATVRYFDIATARKTGYAPLADAQGIQCIAQPGSGAMGVHYVRGDLVGDPSENPLTPEALVYEPVRGGGLRLVALEYVVIQSAWDATHSSPPSLFGHEFMAVDASNRYGLPPFYALHVWLWKFNPSGLFADYNPNVTCAHSTEHYR